MRGEEGWDFLHAESRNHKTGPLAPLKMGVTTPFVTDWLAFSPTKFSLFSRGTPRNGGFPSDFPTWGCPHPNPVHASNSLVFLVVSWGFPWGFARTPHIEGHQGPSDTRKKNRRDDPEEATGHLRITIRYLYGILRFMGPFFQRWSNLPALVL